jgi:hypothetical protein
MLAGLATPRHHTHQPSPRLFEAETQTDLILYPLNGPHNFGGAPSAATTPSRLASPGAFNTARSSGYLSREPSLSRENNNKNNNNTSAASTPRTRGRPFLQREASTASLNGNTTAAASSSSHLSTTCDCPGCPGNPRAGPPQHYQSIRVYDDDDDDPVGQLQQLEDPEDYLDTLDRKVTEIMNRDSSRRSSYNDLAASKRTEDVYGPLSLSYSRKKSAALGGGGDLNCNNQPAYGGRAGGGRGVAEGVIRFEEDDGKASSSEEAMDSSQEDLSQVWSDEDSDLYVLRRRR